MTSCQLLFLPITYPDLWTNPILGLIPENNSLKELRLKI